VLVAPVGPPGQQRLLRFRHGEKGWASDALCAVSFVPLLGGVT
jgi:protein-L-isoaspartate(D-aspartate) O-methyltransferase